jgi:hypothetical protein
MFPHEGEVTALEGRHLSQYSLRACLLVKSMEDPSHRKRQRLQASAQAQKKAVQQEPGSRTEEEREEAMESEELEDSVEEESEASSRDDGEEEESEEEDPDQGTGVDDPLHGVFEEQSGKYNTESLHEAGTSGWPLRAGVVVLVPMYTNAKTAGGKLTAVVYCLMQVTKLVHATYVVTSLPGGSWAIRFSNDNSACFL